MSPPDPNANAPSAPERQDRRERILRAADALFAELGFDAVSVRDVARGAEVNKGLVFYYFGSKQGLFNAVIEQYATAGVEDLAELVPRAGDPRDQVHRIIDAYLDFTERNIRYTQLVLRELTISLDRNLEGVHRYFMPLLNWVMDRLRPLLPEAGPLRAEHFVISIGSAIMNYYLYAPLIELYTGEDPLEPEARRERREHLHIVVDAILDGIPLEA